MFITIFSLRVANIHQLPTDRIDRYIISHSHEALERRGFSQDDVVAWAWTLKGETPDIMLERFLSLKSLRPPFLLLEIIRGDLLTVRSLKSALAYVLNHILVPQKPRVSESGQIAGNRVQQPSSVLDECRGDANQTHQIQLSSFAILVKRLLRQSRRIWPAAMPSIIQMVEKFLRLSFQVEDGLIQLNARSHRRTCKLYNELMHTLSLPSSIDPLKSMAYNWHAQRILLDMAAAFSPPLILDKSSYKAVVRVLAASRKSEKESMVATHRARSWPPWRVYQDGMDALRSPGDDMSRVLSAVNAAKQSGYAGDVEDTAMMILGGQEIDGTPTIHTRKLVNQKAVDVGLREDKFGTLPWAARIYATRDVQEAWSAFQDYRSKGGKPDLQMYHAMLEKTTFETKRTHLELEEDQIGAPGDAKEVFPAPDENYSDYWRTRLQPPTVDGLYKEMRQSGIRPSGRCLDFLIEHSASLSDAVTYLRDSPLSPLVVQYLIDPAYKGMPLDLFRQLPMSTFGAFVKLLCRFAPRRRPKEMDKEGLAKDVSNASINYQSGRDYRVICNDWVLQEILLPVDAGHHQYRRNPLTHAIELVKQQMPRYRPAWYALFAALAREDVVVHPSLLHDSRNDIMACRILIAVLNDFHQCGLEIDGAGFLKLCRGVEKAILASVSINDARRESTSGFVTNIKDEFKVLCETNDITSNLPRLLHDISGVHLHAYIRILGLAGDQAEIITVLKWMTEHSDALLDVSSLARNGSNLMRRAITSAAAFCNETSSQDEARELVESVEFWGGWPDELEIKHYIDNNTRNEQ